MSSVLTDVQRRLSIRYLVYQAFNNFYFVSAVWLYFYRLFVTDQQVGILDACAFAIGLVAEVPSGVLADKFGRDKITKIGKALTASGFLIQAFGSSFIPLFVGQAIMMIGVSFASGADEALFFEKLNFEKNSVHWRKLVSRASQIDLACTLAAIIIGGWLHTINPRLPWIFTGLAFIFSLIPIWSIKDTRAELRQGRAAQKIKHHISGIKEGFAQFLTPNLKLYVPIILTVQGLFYAFGWGLLKPILLARFNFGPFAGSMVIASCAIIAIGLLHLMHRHAERMNEKSMIISVIAGVAGALLLSVVNIGIWGYFVILILYVGERTIYPFMSEVINNRTLENQRATILSVASFLRTIPYVFLAPLVGFLSTHNHLEYFFIGWPILMGIAMVMYLFLKKRDGQAIAVHQELLSESRLPVMEEN
jgi:MFS family permease